MSVVVGISEKGGKAWTFVSNPPAVRKHDFLPEKLQFPDVPTVYQLKPDGVSSPKKWGSEHTTRFGRL